MGFSNKFNIDRIRVLFVPKTRGFRYMGPITGEDIYLSAEGYFIPKSMWNQPMKLKLRNHYKYLINRKK